ncbi:MAG: TIGR04255 family protein [Martelella sp.]|uniref:TIGR04255 family protein n=1 Tax=Martelella sp. TaxID=1969699 RepID=UPI003242019F
MFEPLNKGHAISEATFFFEFENIPETALNLMLEAYQHVADILPRNDPMPGMIFEQSSAGFSMNQVPGAEWKHFRPDGSPDWLARITPNSVSVHCMEYSGWTLVWPIAYRILANIFQSCEDQTLPLINLGLRYVDRFDFKGNVADYDANLLIRPNSPYIASQVRDHGTRWHNYTGWFEPSEKLRMDLLQQLNVDAVEQGPTKLPIVSITHASLLRSQYPGQLDSFRRLTHISESSVATLMDIAHDNNHKLLRKVLTDDMLTRIGLGLGE